MTTTVKELIELLKNYNQNEPITNQYGEDFIHIRSTRDGSTILSTQKPIGYCSKCGEKVYPSDIRKKYYKGYCLDCDENLFVFEIEKLE